MKTRMAEKKYNFCTLFDSHYLLRGIALYRSLLTAGDDFHLYILALDNKCEEILKRESFENVTVIGTSEFESEVLKRIKQERTIAEYCWTCTSFVIEYILTNYLIDEVTYLDADLFFFDSPSFLIDEFRNSNKDVLLMEHRYAEECSYKEDLYGKYNVEFMTFRNTDRGRRILGWWKKSCQEWCYARLEKGKFGDQKYLEYFEEKFSGTYVSKNIGGGIAPWNVNQYEILWMEDLSKPAVNNNPIVFYHFHDLHFYDKYSFDPGDGYGSFSESVLKYIYKPYLNVLDESINIIKKHDPGFEFFYDTEKTNRVRIIENFGLSAAGVGDIMHMLNPQNKKIIIWGAGNNGRLIHKFLRYYDIEIEGVIDTDYKDISDKDFLVQDTRIIKNKKSFVIVSPSNYRDGIIDQLVAWGYKSGEDYITIDIMEREMECLGD